MIGLAALHAVAGWVLICIPVGAMIYVSLVFVMRRRDQNIRNPRELIQDGRQCSFARR